VARLFLFAYSRGSQNQKKKEPFSQSNQRVQQRETTTPIIVVVKLSAADTIEPWQSNTKYRTESPETRLEGGY